MIERSDRGCSDLISKSILGGSSVVTELSDGHVASSLVGSMWISTPRTSSL